jgi:hypothetical protein
MKPYLTTTTLPNAAYCNGLEIDLLAGGLYLYKARSVNGIWAPITKCFIGLRASFPTTQILTGAIATATDLNYQDYYWTGSAWAIVGQNSLSSFVMTVNFGSVYTDSATVTITAPSSLYLGNQVLAWISPELSGTPSSPMVNADELAFTSFTCGCTPVQFSSPNYVSTCYVRASSKVKGSYQMRYAFVNP